MKSELTGVRAKLAAHKETKSGERTVTLARSGVVCTIPNFINHGMWMTAMRQAAGDGAVAQVAFVAEAVKFDGEKLTLTDIRELLDADDGRQIVNEVFGRRAGAETAPGNG